jgi:hypothetical protein
MTTDGPRDAELPRTPEEMTAFLDGLRFTEASVEAPPRLDEAPMVVRSLRLSVDTETRARRVAAERGVPVTSVMREWIEQGLTAAETATREDDPVTELGKRLAEANRVYQVIVNRRDAA